jgi:NAD(P)-dependent dehydrogenase (short-subunit alcohol dehydrogenase family)
MSKVWFITGAGRGMGVDIAKAVLAAGYKCRRHRPEYGEGGSGARRIRRTARRKARRYKAR